MPNYKSKGSCELCGERPGFNCNLREQINIKEVAYQRNCMDIIITTTYVIVRWT